MDGIIDFIECIAALILVCLAYSYFIAFLAKTGNVRFTRYGRTVADPNTLDDLNRGMSNIIKGTVTTLDKIAKITGRKIEGMRKRQIEHVIVDQTKDALAKLKDLAALKENGTINEQEFDLLKKEILNASISK